MIKRLTLTVQVLALFCSGAFLARAGPAEPLGPSSRRTALVISEIMYHPLKVAGPLSDASYIELYNSSAFSEDISGFWLSGSVTNRFSPGTVLPPHSFLVVAQDPNTLMALYGLTNVAGPFTNSLPNDSGTVMLLNRTGAILLSVKYEDGPPWPAAADGGGHSLVLARPSLGESNSAAWAASRRIGGSPGMAEPEETDELQNILINEVYAGGADGTQDFIEVYNHGNQPVDLGGCVLTNAPGTNQTGARLFVGSIVPPGGFLAFYRSQLGFAVDPTQGKLFLLNSNATRVVDAVRYKGIAPGSSTGRFPNGAAEFYSFTRPSPNASNLRPPASDVVINEISYHPLTTEPTRDYIELYNRSSNKVDLTGWTLGGGISLSLAHCDTLYPGEFRVLDVNLSDLGERLVLRRPTKTVTTNLQTQLLETNQAESVVQELTFWPGGRWGHWSAGGGATLELVDGRANPRWAPNWGDSSVPGGTNWNLLGTTDTVTDLIAPGDTLQVMLRGEGEALLDDVQVIGDGGDNRVSNSDFESGTNVWIFQGNHVRSTWETTDGFGGGHSLHLRASSGGDTRANRVSTHLTRPVAPDETVTIRARVRWLVGEPKILLRLKGTTVEASADLGFQQGGTPGLANSRAADNIGPAIFDVSHFPVVPAGGEPVVVTARLDDPDGIASARLIYRVDPSGATNTVPLRDDGTGGDTVGGDGFFTGTLPPQAAGTLVAFYVEADDGAATPAGASFPDDSPQRECLVRWGDATYDNPFGTYRLWMTQATRDRWAQREKLSNEPLDVTFVYGTNRVIYGARSRYSGSPATSDNYDTPTGTLCVYDVDLPPDDPLFGATHLILDFPTGDDTAQRQQTMYWFLDQLGLPFHHRQYVNLFVNGIGQRERSWLGVSGTIFEDTQEPDFDSVLEWFPQSRGGHLYKADDWMEFSDEEVAEASVPPTLERFSGGNSGYDLARYRWNWRHRDASGKGSSYSALFSILDALGSADANALDWQEAILDVENWMRTFAMNDLAANWDSLGNLTGRNTFIFKPDYGATNGTEGSLPDHGQARLFSWDFDVGLGLADALPDAPLFTATDPTVAQMFTQPAWQRAYWRALEEACNGFFHPAAVGRRVEEHYAALRTVAATSPASIIDFVNLRRSFLTQELAAVQAPWGVTSFDFIGNYLVIGGTAPLVVSQFTLNSNACHVTWTSVTDWQMELVLDPGTNILKIAARDRSGNLVPGTATSIKVLYFGSVESISNLVINEILNYPAAADTEFIEIFNAATNTAFDLGKVALSGLLSDPEVANRLTNVAGTFFDGTILRPQEYAVSARNRLQFYAAFGAQARVAGEFGGDLFDPDRQGPAAMALTLDSGAIAFPLQRFPMPLPQAGVSLQLLDAREFNWLPGNWATDPVPKATPGAANSVAIDLSPFPRVAIIQVVPLNATLRSDSNGLFNPFLLLYNLGKASIDIGGYQLSFRAIPEEEKDLDRAFVQAAFPRLAMPDPVWTFPTGSVIEPNHGRIVWLDAQPERTSPEEWHANFRPDTNSGRLVLSRPLNGRDIYLDHFDYGVEAPPTVDVRYGRYSIGWGFGGIGVELGTGVPGSTNPPSPGLVFANGTNQDLGTVLGGPVRTLPWPQQKIDVAINEWMASNTCFPDPADGNFDDWFELFNRSTTDTVYLKGCILSDDPTTNKFVIPQGFSIPPRGFLLVWADDEIEQNDPKGGGDLHVNFKLKKSGETLALRRPDAALVDSVTFGEQKDNVSQGRWRDGESGLISMTNATPRQPNYPGDWPVCGPPTLHISRTGPSSMLLWFPAADCRGEFVAQCREDLSDLDWETFSEGALTWDVPTQRYLWVFLDPAAKDNRHRFYRVVSRADSIPPCPSQKIDVAINEWMATNTRFPDPADGKLDDWFELFNRSTTNTVDLNGCILSDDPSTDKFVIPQGYSIPPRGFLLVWADDEIEQNDPGGSRDLHVNFKLGKKGETILLRGPDGELVDSVTFGRQSDNVSQGRWRDGGSDLISMTNASPRRPNYPDDWPVCGPPTLHISRTGPSSMLMWFPVVDCRGDFFVQGREDLSDSVWETLPGDGLRWDAPTQRYLWVFPAPDTEGNRYRFYRVLRR